MAARVYWLWLSTRPGIGARAAGNLLDYFGSPEAVYAASRGALLMCDGLTPAQINGLCDKNLNGADRLLEDCTKKNIRILTLADSNYPDRLRHIYDPPIVLYWYGRTPAWDIRPMISIVGSRRGGAYGKMMARQFASSLTESGFLIVSGMASGIDGEANDSAVLAGGSVAVLGCGVDICFPKENRRLYENLRLGGTLVSEYPPGTEPAGWRFPQRNRIISGLSIATIVIEAPLRSGALITARLALDQGRDVYAVPGDLDKWRSAGCNALIRDHAADLLTDPVQLLHAYGGLLREPPDERRIYRIFHGQPVPKRPDAKPAPESRKKEPVLPHPEQPPSAASKIQEAEKPSEILEALPIKPASELPRPSSEVPLPEGLSPEEHSVLEAVRAGAKSTDQLIAATGLPAAQLLSLVTMLELDALLCNEGGIISLP